MKGHHHSNHHIDSHLDTAENDIDVSISIHGDFLNIKIQDQEGKVPELEVTHEKIIHLILISEDLKEFYHLHPVQKEDLTFEAEFNLKGNSYRAFVDIAPKGKNYAIKAIPVVISSRSNSHFQEKANLTPDTQFMKEINGKKVELQYDKLELKKSITLNFKIIDAGPEPYLGALGHVVIIDQGAQNFIHVHPLANNETRFQVLFNKKGIYKLWAEFKFEGKVYVYPYVLEVK